MRTFLRVGIALIILILSTVVLASFIFYFIHPSFIYDPFEQDFEDCYGFRNAEKIYHNGTRMYFKQNSEKVIVFFHATSGSACDIAFLAPTFEKHNLSYIIPEYTGYSNDGNKPLKKFILEDVQHISDFVESHQYETVLVGGSSLGTGLASYFTNLQNVDGVLLVSPYYSIIETAKIRFGGLAFLITEDYDNAAYLENYEGHVMIIHGENDPALPISLSKKLFDGIKTTNKEFIEVPDGGHGDIFEYNLTMINVNRFLAQN